MKQDIRKLIKYVNDLVAEAEAQSKGARKGKKGKKGKFKKDWE